MRVRRRIALGLIGLLLLLSWSFRLMVIYSKRVIDPFLFPHLAVALVFVAGGVFLFWLALQKGEMRPTQNILLIFFAFFMMASGAWRAYAVLSDPSHDPNPRAHLRLAEVFVLFSLYLAWIVWKGRRRAESSPSLGPQEGTGAPQA